MSKENDQIVSYLSLHENLFVNYYKQFFSQKMANHIYHLLENNTKYNTDEESMVRIGGRFIKIPRKQVAYGDKGTFYRFTGKNYMRKHGMKMKLEN